MKSRTIFVALVLAVSLASFGAVSASAANSNKSQAAATATNYMNALGKAQASKICALYSNQSKTFVQTCVTSLKDFFSALPANVKTKLKKTWAKYKVKPGQVKIKGKTAKVTVKSNGDTQTVNLVKLNNGKWRVKP